MKCAHVSMVLILLGIALPLPSQQVPTFFSVPPADAPELSHRGGFAVGVRTLEVRNPGQPDILNFNKTTGAAPLYDRPLTVEIWYPALLPAGAIEQTNYEMKAPTAAADKDDSGKPQTLSIAGKALRDAPPATGKSYPLVIVSHGYPGSRYFLSYLSENLASKGYVVAAIDHTDSVFGDEKGFQSTLLNRANDQLFTVGALLDLAASPGHFLKGLVDPARVAIIGYSMGGYGALASAGAGYSPKSFGNVAVPGGYFHAWESGGQQYQARLRREVKAVVAISPWGAQAPYSAWDADGLAGIRIPLLVLAGDQDDVSDFQAGIKPAFDKAIHSDRCLLVYQNARHNIGGNPLPPDLTASFRNREFFEEPVWRKDRLMAINEHFITAFLDLHLKGDESKRSYLHVTPALSNDGTWPLPQGQSVGDKVSDGTNYWKGFQRRWALGMSMTCVAAAQ
jgi:predicted dienelactone hydrolase